MTSLMPFDFRCVGQLTGISLRCAPLRVVLPPEWPSIPLDAPEAREKPIEQETVLDPGVMDPSALPSPHVMSPGANGTPELVRTNSIRTPSSATPLPPPAMERTHAPFTQPSSGNRSPAVAKPAAVAAVAPTDPLSKTRTRRPAPPVINLHDPALCIETFFELRPMNGIFSGDENSFASLKSEEKRVEKSENPVTPITTCDGASGAPLYTSEVVRGSSHPNWSSIPASALQPYSHNTQIELAVFYTGAYISKAWTLTSGNPETELFSSSTEGIKSSPLSAAPPIGDEEFVRHDIVASTPSDVCVHRCRIDFRRTFYLGATLEEADAAFSRLLHLEEQRTQGQRQLPRPLVYLRCSDGIFVPTSCFSGWQAPVADTFNEWQAARTRTFCPAPTAADFQGISSTPSSLNAIAGRNSLAAVAAAQAAAACKVVQWSQAPSAMGWRYPAFAIPRAGQQRASIGDVKAAAYTTLAWERLASAAEQREAALSDQLNAEAKAHPTERAVAAQCAAVRVQLSAAREALTLSTLELENLRDRVGQRQRRLLREEEALAAVHQYEKKLKEDDTVNAQREQVRAEEAQRAQLRAKVARGRQQRVRELCLIYAVTLSSQYASYACANAADAKDCINNAVLPILFAGRADADAASHLVASTADDMHEEAVGLGHACHLLVVLSILYSCTLPYPILLSIGQSHVLTSPNVDAVQMLVAPLTLAEARKYPLYCNKVSERPLMMAGVHLLLRDGAVLAKAMGKPERCIAACADRLGALLDLLLSDAE